MSASSDVIAAITAITCAAQRNRAMPRSIRDQRHAEQHEVQRGVRRHPIRAAEMRDSGLGAEEDLIELPGRETRQRQQPRYAEQRRYQGQNIRHPAHAARGRPAENRQRRAETDESDRRRWIHRRQSRHSAGECLDVEGPSCDREQSRREEQQRRPPARCCGAPPRRRAASDPPRAPLTAAELAGAPPSFDLITDAGSGLAGRACAETSGRARTHREPRHRASRFSAGCGPARASRRRRSPVKAPLPSC